MAHKQSADSDMHRRGPASGAPPGAGRAWRRAGRCVRAAWLPAIAAGCLALAGCSSAPRPAYPETFKDTNTYSRAYPATNAATCEAARRALLSQGYTIGKAQTDGVEGQKNFQVQDDEKQHQVISFHVVCTSDHQAQPNTTVFVNAVQDRYIIKKTTSSAGVGLSVLGSVSMPFGSNDDSLAKVSSETISTPSFYDGFFELLQRYLPQSESKGGAAQTMEDGMAQKTKDSAAEKTPADANTAAPSSPSSPSPKPATTTPPATPAEPAAKSPAPTSAEPTTAGPAAASPAPAAAVPAAGAPDGPAKPADSGVGGATAVP